MNRKHRALLLIYSFFTLLIASCSNSESKKEAKNDLISIQEAFKTDSILTVRYRSIASSIDSISDINAQDSLLRAYYLNHEQEYQPQELIKSIALYEKQFSSSKSAFGFANEERAIVFLRTSQLDTAGFYVNKALIAYEESGERKSLARCYNVQAGILGFQGRLDDTFESQFKALDIYKALADSNGIYETIRELGNTCYRQHLFDRALSLFQKSLTYYIAQRDTFMQADLYNAIGNSYHQLNKQKESEQAVYKSIELKKKIKDDFGMAESYGSLALISMGRNDWQEGKELLEKSIAIFEQIGDTRGLYSMMYNLGVCEMELNHLQLAEKIFNEVIETSQKNGIQEESLQRTLQRKYSILKKEGRIQEASECLETLLAMKDTLFSQEKNRFFEEMNVKYETQLKEEKLQNIQNENARIREKRFFLIIGLVIVILLSIGLFYLLIKRNQQARLLHSAESMLHQKQLDETLRELAFNRKQLDNFTQHLVEKNKFINDLESKISTKTDTPTEVQDDELAFSNLMQLKILTEEDWIKFKLYFEKAFPGFILKLRTEYSNLTGSEQRLFLLIKLKNDSREMSDMLGISMESVRKNKYRLKKKLLLDENQSLEEFIMNY